MSSSELACHSLDQDPPLFEYWVAEDMTKCGDNGNTAGTLVGYTLFYPIISCEGKAVYMEDLYVSQPHRNRGIGQVLWATAIQVKTARENEPIMRNKLLMSLKGNRNYDSQTLGSVQDDALLFLIFLWIKA